MYNGSDSNTSAHTRFAKPLETRRISHSHPLVTSTLRRQSVYRAPTNGKHRRGATHFQSEQLNAGDGEVGGLEACCGLDCHPLHAPFNGSSVQVHLRPTAVRVANAGSRVVHAHEMGVVEGSLCSTHDNRAFLYSLVPLDRNIRHLLGIFVGCQVQRSRRDCRALTTRLHLLNTASWKVAPAGACFD